MIGVNSDVRVQVRRSAAAAGGSVGVFGWCVRVPVASMSERRGDDEAPPADQAEVEAVESGEVEPGTTAEEVERAAEREEEALEG